MRDRDENELTAAEKEAYAELARARMPGRLLEERVVAALRARGLLGSRHALRARGARLRAAAAAAAGFALFAGGVAVGQWLGARHTAESMLALQRQEAASAAALVERTGSAYLSALDEAAQAPAAGDPQEAARAREAARAVLHRAADQMVRLAPDDPVAAEILQGLERARLQSAALRPESRQRLVWF